MANYPPELTPEQLREYFPYKRPLLKDGVFELGLVLGGTGSAGAYTAGVLDYLLEALDAWQCAREDQSTEAPPHKVAISTIAGSSGGGVNGGIFLRAAGCSFPHGAKADNPFYSFWMGNASNLWELLRPGPAAGIPGLTSLLNSTPIDVQASQIIEFRGQDLGTGDAPRCRAFLADPLRLFIMVGNLEGIPYAMRLSGESELSHALCAHDDFMRFALRTGSDVSNAPATRPDEIQLTSEWPPDGNWMRLRAAAVATGAFPILLLPRLLSRWLATVGYRATAVPKEDGGSSVVQLVPEWPILAAGEHDQRQSTFLSVDGGVFNNEPFDLVRTALAGMTARNPRDSLKANRAVVMIDPFSDPEALQRPEAGNVASVFGAIISSLISQARFKAEDVALARDESVFSRYLISPVGPGPYGQRTVGQSAIASGALSGHAGFIDPSFRDYDFHLGRLNTYKFLATHLALPVDLVQDHDEFRKRNNPIFHGWDKRQIETYVFEDPHTKKKYLPIIPLMPNLKANPPRLPEWPRLAEMPDYIEGTVRGRLQSLYDLATTQLIPGPWWKRLLPKLYVDIGWKLHLRDSLRDATVEAIKGGLASHGLLSSLPPVRTTRAAAAAVR